MPSFSSSVSGINRNSPSRASIKIVLPPVIPQTTVTEQTQKLTNCSQQQTSAAAAAAAAAQSSKQGQGSSTQLQQQQQQQQLSSFSEQQQQQPFYDANNYYSIRPSMQQIPEQTAISLFAVGGGEELTNTTNGSINSNSSSGNSSVTSAELLLSQNSSSEQQQIGKYGNHHQQNRYSSSSLDSGRGSDSLKLTAGGNPGSGSSGHHHNHPHHHPNNPNHHHQHNRVSVHSCESIGSTSSIKDSESSSASQPSSSSLSSSSSTSSSFCSSSSSSSTTPSSFPQQHPHLQQQSLQPNSHQYPSPNQPPHQYSAATPNRNPQQQHPLSSSSSIVSNCDSPSSTSSSSTSSSNTSCVTPVGDFTVHSSSSGSSGSGSTAHKNNVFSSAKGNTIYASMMMPSTIIGGRRPTPPSSNQSHLTPSSSSSSSTSASTSSDNSAGHHHQNGGAGGSGSSSSSSLVAQAGPPSIAEMILHGISDPEIIHNWLAKIKLGKYERCFVEAGYDMATIARMTPQDLIAVGITDPKARSTFTAEIGKLNFPDGIPTHKAEWLKLLGLECYHAPLVQQGYATIDRVTELDCEDFEDVGIFKLGHQKKLLLAIKRVKMLSRSAGRQQSVDGQEIYGTITGGSESVKEPMEPPNPNLPIHHLTYQPMIMQSSHYQMHQQMHGKGGGGGSALNSPSHPEMPPSFDHHILQQNILQQQQQHQPLHIITSSSSSNSNIVPSALFCTPNSKTPNSAMRTFSSQLSEGGGNPSNFSPQIQSYLQQAPPPPQPTYPHVNGVPVPNAIPYYPPGAMHAVPPHFGAPTLSTSAVSRGRSLESLDSMSPYANYHQLHQQQHQQQQQHFPYQQQQSYPQGAPPYYRGSPQLQQQQFPYQQQQQHLSNGELNLAGIHQQHQQQQQQHNRQTVNYEVVAGQASMMANFNFNYGNPVSYEPFDGTTTLNRPKNLLGGKPVAKILASARSSGDLGPPYYDGSFDTASLQSNDSSKTAGDNLSLSSDSGASIYSSVNKTGKKPPPPPPPKRVNSIKKLPGSSGSASVPSSPLHHQQQNPSATFSDQVYSNLMYLNGGGVSNLPQQQQNQQQQQQALQNNQIINSNNSGNVNNFYNDDSNSRLTEDVFASCVKSLTSKFSEAVVAGDSQSPNGDGPSCITPSKIASFNKSAAQQPQPNPSSTQPPQYPSQANSSTTINNNNNTPSSFHNPNHHTLPMNKEKMNSFLQENGVAMGSGSNDRQMILESVNVSSSSSTESMPFAADNVGTIRQNSSSATSSPMFARNPHGSLPGSAFNSPMSATAVPSFAATSGAPSGAAAAPEFDNGFGQPGDNSCSITSSNLPNASNDSRQKHVVDSLEDIEIMLANLKTQLDSIYANFRPKVKVISGGNSLASSGFSGRGKILENSPIYYLKVGNAGLRNGNKNPPLSSSSFLSPSPSPSSSLMLSGVSLKRRVNSNLYKLPLSFVSNAKPVEIIQGITGKKKKPFIDYHSSSSNRVKVHSNALGSSNYKHSSKVFYLPTKFVSNGKPVKPILFSSTSKVNNNSGKRKFYQHYYGSKKRLKYGQF
ncbi:hypothetical protein TYRP_005688 [Tyrophagus putrescentiae]|nr:hypothetical protein TYRP_005688 [Tyrophagus putrescentiae]